MPDTGAPSSGTSVVNKRCTRCGTSLPTTAFQIRRRNPDGTPHTWHSWCIECEAHMKRERKAERRKHAGTVQGEPAIHLPAQPFAIYLRAYMERHDLPPKDAAAIFQTNERILWRILHGEQSKIALDLVDRMLCAASLPGVLMELYPSLYEFSEREAA